MGIPRVYRKSGERAIASFDFIDIAAGTGYVRYFLMRTQDASPQYNLTATQLYSSDIETTQTEVSGTLTLTFDSGEFNLPRTIKGTAFLNLGVDWDVSASSTVTARLYKWDGSSATPITPLNTRSFGSGVFEGVLSYKMPCTQTQIKKGEQLRLVIALDQTGGTGTTITIGNDPQNRDGTRITPSSQESITSSRINIPFNIDL